MAGGIQGGGQQGAYPQQPAPKRRQGANGVLIWSMVGCGVIALLLVIFGAVVANRFVHNPGGKGFIGVMTSVTPAAQSVRTMGTSIESYQKDHDGKYPPTLEALIPKYVADKAALSCGSSEDPKPMEYSQPKPDASVEAVVVRVHIGDIVLPNQRQQMYICLLKSGDVVSEQVARTIMSKSEKTSPQSRPAK